MAGFDGTLFDGSGTDLKLYQGGDFQGIIEKIPYLKKWELLPFGFLLLMKIVTRQLKIIRWTVVTIIGLAFMDIPQEIITRLINILAH